MHLNISRHSISPVICVSKMRCTWSRHIMRCWSRDEEINAPQKMWWRSFLRWGTVKVKILMIRFETKTWLMENQVKLSSSGDMTAVILTLTWSKSANIWHQRMFVLLYSKTLDVSNLIRWVVNRAGRYGWKLYHDISVSYRSISIIIDIFYDPFKIRTRRKIYYI